MESLAAQDLDFGIDVSLLGADGPAEARGITRDEVKMLVIDPTQDQVTDTNFRRLPDFLSPGDVLVVNTSLTIPARLSAESEGESHAIHLAARLSSKRFIIERRGPNGEADSRAWSHGEEIRVVSPAEEIVHEQTDVTPLRNTHTAARLRVVRRFHPNSRLWEVDATTDLYQLALRIGSPVRYSYLKHQTGQSDYETIFARVPGSAEMPSASRPFTKAVLRTLVKGGVKVASVTLHTSVSSHEVEHDLSTHPVLPEWFSVPAQTAAIINHAKSNGHRVIAVGTTAVRAIESAVLANGQVTAKEGWTTHLVTPSTPPKVITSLVTGMHDNQTSHLALMYAFLSRQQLKNAYQFAANMGYLWHEFGDISLIL